MQVTKIFEQEYENSFEINVDKGKLVNISSREALDDGITESILNMVDVGKSRMEDFGHNRLVSKEISFDALIKKSNYKSFPHVMPKIQITKKE